MIDLTKIDELKAIAIKKCRERSLRSKPIPEYSFTSGLRLKHGL